MKKVFFTLMIAVFGLGFSQTCIPDLVQLPKDIQDKIKYSIDPSISKSKFTKSKELTTEQQNLVTFFNELSKGLKSNRELTKDEQSKIESLKKNASTSEIYNWIIKTANDSEDFEVFHKQIIEKIKTCEDIEDVNYLIIVDYSLQIAMYDLGNEVSNNKARCKGWWSCWGRCTAGILGGAGLGGLAGAAITTPTVVGVPVGVAIGVVAGGLSGAAAACG